MDTTELRYLSKWKTERRLRQADIDRLLNQIRFQLVENMQLKKELDEAMEIIEIYVEHNPLRLKETVEN